MRICLDTSAYSNFQRAKPEAIDIVSRAEWVGMPSVVIGELEVGFRRGTQYFSNAKHLEEFASYHFVEVLKIDREIAEIYAEIHVQLTRMGKPMPTNDVWIAATSAGVGATLVTYDNHFLNISRIGTIVL